MHFLKVELIIVYHTFLEFKIGYPMVIPNDSFVIPFYDTIKMILNKNSSGPKISFKVASKFPPANSDDLIGNPQSRISASSKLLFTIRSVNILISYPGPPGLRTNKHGFHGYSRRSVLYYKTKVM